MPRTLLDQELRALSDQIMQLGSLADDALTKALESFTFNHPHDGSKVDSMVVSWVYYHEIPPVLVARLRIPS